MKRLLYFLTCLAVACGQGWDYDRTSGTSTGPAAWSTLVATCGLSSQSPIDVDTSSATELDTLTEFTFTNYDTTSGLTLELGNEAQGLTITPSGVSMTLTTGGLSEGYTLDSIVFKWGLDDSTGSEHTINGMQYPLEAQFLHYKTSAGALNAAAATGTSDAFAVFVVLFETDGTNENTALTDLVNDLSSITTSGTTTQGTVFNIKNIFKDAIGTYYRYEGSLTIPGCNEIVTWTVFQTPLKLSTTQMAEFRTLLDSSGNAADNWRPVQSLGSRTVSKYNSAAVTKPAISILFVVALIISIFNETFLESQCR